MKLKPLQYRSESPVQGMSDQQQESRGFNPVRKSSSIPAEAPSLREKERKAFGQGAVSSAKESAMTENPF